MSASNVNPLSYLKNPSLFSFFVNPVSELEVLDIINKLDSHKGSGHDHLNAAILKEIIPIILKPLTYVINSSFSSGFVPSHFKLAKVVPVHKKDDVALATNYRPISILPLFSKITEKLMHTIGFIII